MKTMMAATPDASAEHIARMVGISVRSARRFKSAGQWPFLYALAWAICAEGDVGAADPAFRGWKMRDGQLYTPEGTAFRPGEIASIPLRMQQVSSMQRELSQPRQLMLSA